MKKQLSTIGILISVIGLFGSFVLLGENDTTGWYALAVYGFFMAQSIVFYRSVKI